MDFAIGLHRGLPTRVATDPELRPPLGSVPDGNTEIHLPREAQNPENLVIECRCGWQIRTVDTEMIDHDGDSGL